VERARQRAAVSARPPDVNAPVKAPIERDFRLMPFLPSSRAGSNGFGGRFTFASNSSARFVVLFVSRMMMRVNDETQTQHVRRVLTHSTKTKLRSK